MVVLSESVERELVREIDGARKDGRRTRMGRQFGLCQITIATSAIEPMSL